MTLHKIDREKLAEVLADICDKNGKPKYCNDYQDLCVAVQAAQNWLTITDPGFEVSDGMYDTGYTKCYEDEYDLDVVFKAMIAKAGE